MKLLLQIVVVAALGWVLAQFLPWWSIALAGGLAALGMTRHLGRSFLAGFLGGFIFQGSSSKSRISHVELG